MLMNYWHIATEWVVLKNDYLKNNNQSNNKDLFSVSVIAGD